MKISRSFKVNLTNLLTYEAARLTAQDNPHHSILSCAKYQCYVNGLVNDFLSKIGVH